MGGREGEGERGGAGRERGALRGEGGGSRRLAAPVVGAGGLRLHRAVTGAGVGATTHASALLSLPLEPPGRPRGGARAAEPFNRAAAAALLRPSPGRGGGLPPLCPGCPALASPVPSPQSPGVPCHPRLGGLRPSPHPRPGAGPSPRASPGVWGSATQWRARSLRGLPSACPVLGATG